jgi:hypothetical protein
MRAGPCAGTGTGPCQNSGWSPNWLPPLAWADHVEALVGSETVCPFCVARRARAAGIPGFSNQKLNRILNALTRFYCMSPTGSRSVDHTHLLDYVNETWGSRGSLQPPGDGERGY